MKTHRRILTLIIVLTATATSLLVTTGCGKSAEQLEQQAVSHMDKKEWQQAIDLLTKAAIKEPGNPIYYLRKAQCHLKMGNVELAEDNFKTAKGLIVTISQQTQPEILAEFYYSRGACYYDTGHPKVAIEGFEKALSIDPAHHRTMNEYAWALATCEDKSFRNPAKALTLAKKACEIESWKDFHAVDTLAAAYASNGEFEEAVETQKRAMRLPCTQEELLKMEERLQLYQAGKPYYEPVKE